MSAKTFLVVLVIFAIGAGIFIPRWFVEDLAPIVDTTKECLRTDVQTFLNDPIERALLSVGDIYVTHSDAHGNIIEGYTLFGLPFVTLRVTGCHGSVERISAL